MTIYASSPIAEESLKRKLRNFGVAPSGAHSSLNNYTCIKIPEDHTLVSVYNWCEINLKDDWIWSNPQHTDYVKIWFKTEYDATVFTLKFNTY
jgi:hypothetical protein